MGCGQSQSNEAGYVVAHVTFLVNGVIKTMTVAPLVGNFCFLLFEVRKAYSDIAQVVTEADAVLEWATNQLKLFKALETPDAMAHTDITDVLRTRKDDAAKAIEVLLKASTRITEGRNALQKFLRGAVFSSAFKKAKEGVEDVMKHLGDALLPGVYVGMQNLHAKANDTQATIVDGKNEVLGAVQDVKNEILSAIHSIIPTCPAPVQAVLAEATERAELIRVGNVAVAEAVLADAPEEVKNLAVSLFLGGYALLKAGVPAAAIGNFREAVGKDRKMSHAWYALGYALCVENGGPCEDAIAPMEQCIKFDREHSLAYHGLGMLLECVRNDFPRAEEMYNEAIKLDANDSEAHRGLGYIMYKRGDYDGAETSFGTAIALDWNLANAHLGLAEVHLRKGNRVAALQSYRDVAELEPTHSLAFYNIFAMLAQNEDYVAAEQMFQKAAGLNPPNSELEFDYDELHEQMLHRLSLNGLSLNDLRRLVEHKNEEEQLEKVQKLDEKKKAQQNAKKKAKRQRQKKKKLLAPSQ